MKKLITLFAFITLSISLSAQSNCDCKAELEFVYEQMQTMASFKSQIKGQKIEEFEVTYQKLSSNVSTDMNKAECYVQMNQLLSLVKDKHAGVYEVGPDYTYEDTLDSAFVLAYRETRDFKDFPKVDLDLEKLVEDLGQKSLTDVEGIYNIGSSMKVGVYRIANSDSLMGVMLESKLGVWEPGQIYLYMKATDKPNRYDIVAYGQVHKNLLFYNDHLVSNGILMRNVTKECLSDNFIHVDREAREAYQLITLENDIQYVWFDSFSRFGNAKKRDAIVEQIQKELTASNLIVDLRNNGGGASKISVPIVKAIRKSGVKVYVLTNFASSSNAEQTTVRLRNIKSTVHLGQTTYGAIAYGINYGTTYESPSGQFYFVPTDMKFNHFLKYEEVGVQPMIELSSDSDWIEQTINIIKTQDQQ
ncbi:hypothetical protein BFP97_01015 [Roseivirga sp. 4D4]|uniref:S41 family peptidase n=1 Tax=Roseivirga sp. 4D4 TaxID=1889784 RepID=UPI000853C3DC|nr:S41 family peptidase [Roseivirga sp. 4D4]OEK00179.1 hypothetical protein BFP97_01015 [Roseivirga sp. 4D4]